MQTNPARIVAACDAIAATVARTVAAWPVTPAPALPRLPADLLAECERAAGIAMTHNEEPTS